MKFYSVLLAALIICSCAGPDHDCPTDLRCEFTVDPVCIDATSPRLSWVMQSDLRNGTQTAYRILVASDESLLDKDKGDMWDSGKVLSNKTFQVYYEGKELESASDYYWKVMLWDAEGNTSGWSKCAKWTMGLLRPEAWENARLIAFKDRQTWQQEWYSQKEAELRNAPPGNALGSMWPWYNGKDSTIFALEEMGHYDPAPLFRKEFCTKGKVARADLFICGLGYYVPYLNGKRVGDRVLNPAWSNFNQRSLYDRYDVTDLIDDDNAIGVMLGRGQLNPICNDIWGLSRSSWIDEPKMIALLKIQYEDGSEDNIVSDESWMTAGGPVIYDDTRHGELYDARLEKEGWNKAGYDDSDWKQASSIEWNARLEAQAMPPVRRFAPVKPVRVVDSMNGSKVYELERQIAGWAKVTVKGPEGTKVLVEYCERPSNKELCPDLAPSCYQYNIPDPFYASFYDKTINVRQQNGYIMKGDGDETFECMFSYKGFRFIRVSADADIQIKSVEGIPVHTDFETTGSFECSDENLNKLQANSITSMYSNFMSIPTDCPHREKQGWTCDTYIVSRASMFNFNMGLFMEKWVKDLALSQLPDGGLTTVAPSTGYDGGYSTTWPIAIIHVPLDAYHFYGDSKILSDNYKCMEAFAASSMNREIAGKSDIINDVLGDWISPHKEIIDSIPHQFDTAPPEGLPFYGTSSHFLAHKKLADISGILGNDDRKEYYDSRSAEIAGSFNAEFYDPQSHSYHGTNPTEYRQSTNVTALHYGLVPDTQKKAVEDELIRQIHLNDDFLSTGFLGIYSMMDYLPDIKPELAYKMATRPEYPSWGYMIEKGATSMWETWDGYDSQNHLPFCMISEYFYSHLAGIKFDESDPGFHHFTIKPDFIQSLDYVNCHFNSISGRIESNWKRTSAGIELNILVPGNTSATVFFPDEADNLKEYGDVIVPGEDGVLSVDDNSVTVGSGRYFFTFSL